MKSTTPVTLFPHPVEAGSVVHWVWHFYWALQTL